MQERKDESPAGAGPPWVRATLAPTSDATRTPFFSVVTSVAGALRTYDGKAASAFSAEEAICRRAPVAAAFCKAGGGEAWGALRRVTQRGCRAQTCNALPSIILHRHNGDASHGRPRAAKDAEMGNLTACAGTDSDGVERAPLASSRARHSQPARAPRVPLCSPPYGCLVLPFPHAPTRAPSDSHMVCPRE